MLSTPPTLVACLLCAILAGAATTAGAQEPGRCTVGHGGLLPVSPPALEATPAPSPANLSAWIETLAAPVLRGRYGGSPEAAQVAVLLADQLGRFGYSGALAGGDMCQLFAMPYSGPDHNVVARLGTGEPDRPVVIVMAHYDMLGGDSYAGGFYPGANDNASGVAVLMEVARVAALTPEAWPFDLVMLAPGAQMHGLVGSQHFVLNPPVPLEQVRLVIELDAVGSQLLDGLWARGLLGDPVDTIGYAGGDLGESRVGPLVDAAAAATGVSVMGVPQQVLEIMSFSSDVSSFVGRAPTLALSTGATADFQTTLDTPDRVDIGQVERAARLVLGVLEQLRAQTALP